MRKYPKIHKRKLSPEYLCNSKCKAMERITKERIFEFIAENTIELKCKQPRLCVPMIDRLYRKMLAGIKFTEIGG
jgi:hypothetical protein